MLNNVPTCGYCGRPIVGTAVYFGAQPYHPECTRGPSYFQPLTDTELIQIMRTMPTQPWGIGSRPHDALAYARVVLEAAQPAAPVKDEQ